MYKLMSCKKGLLSKKIEKINEENSKIISIIAFDTEWYDIVVEINDRVVY